MYGDAVRLALYVHPVPNYVKVLDTGALSGARIGAPRSSIPE